MILIKSKPGFKNVHKTPTKLNKNKSSGTDGLSQEQLILGADSLCDPLIAIVKKSLETGEFSQLWKKALKAIKATNHVSVTMHFSYGEFGDMYECRHKS